MKVKNQIQIRRDGHFYKGNLHSHTVNSDGKLKPEEAVELFKSHGYQFLCFSEHDRYTDYRAQFNDDQFIILPGLEASCALYDHKGGARLKVHHIHGILGTEEMQRHAKQPLFRHMEFVEPPAYYGTWDGALAAQELADHMAAHGCITTYNHPIWSRVRESEFIDTEGITALEIFNYNTVNESGTGYDVTYWDVMLREGKNIWAIASDDNHNEGIFDDACGGYIVVQAEKLEHDSVIRSIQAGTYYSSSGPEIFSWKVEDGIASIECSNVRRINFVCGNHVNDGITYMTDDVLHEIHEGSYRLKGHETYIRAECIDWLGRTAWSNPIFL